MSNRRKGIRDLEFLLQSNVSPAPKLDDLRINILDFLRVTSYLDSRDRKLTFQIGDTNDKASVSLVHLRTCTLVALTDFQQTYKRTRPDTKRCPNIWVNGYGRILCVKGPDGKSINPSETIQRTMSREDGGGDAIIINRDFRKKYGGNAEDGDSATPPGRSFDDTLGSYLGYLQSVVVGDEDAAYWAGRCKFFV